MGRSRLIHLAVCTAVVAGLAVAAPFTAVTTASAAPPADAVPHLISWGSNTWGQMGTGAAANSFAPASDPALVQNPGSSTFVSISSSPDHSVGVDADGRVWAWGDNEWGPLGQDPAVLRSSLVPVPVDALPSGTYTQAVAGVEWSAALRDDGAVFTWGWGASGQLGNGTTPPSDQANPTPVQVSFPEGSVVTSIQAGNLYGIGVLSDGSLWAWGDNIYGQLGDDESATVRNVPAPVTLPDGVTAFTQVSAGSISLTALDASGAMYGWGSNVFANLAVGSVDGNGAGDPDIVSAPRASHMPDGVTFVQTSQSTTNGLALGDDGNVYAWGSDDTGQLGHGHEGHTVVHPGVVTLPEGVTPTNQMGCITDGCALLASDGRVLVWGSSTSGLFGDDPNGDQKISVPQVVHYTENHPASSLYLGQANPFIVADAERPHISTDTLPSAELGTTYSTQVAFGGTSIVTASISAGALPGGLALAPDGTISGTPDAAGAFSVTVRAQSAAGSAEHDYTLTVTDPSKPGGDAHHGDDGAKGVVEMTPALHEKIQKRVDEFRKVNDLPGLSVAVVTSDPADPTGSTPVVTTFVAGVPVLGSSTPVDASTQFELGSETKIFTADLLANLVASGRVSLDDTVQQFAPAGVTVPEWVDQKSGAKTPITLRDLATHQAGLPDEPTNFGEGCTGVPDCVNPHPGYTQTMLWDGLEQQDLLWKPGTKWLYSNWGFGLLGTILSNVVQSVPESEPPAYQGALDGSFLDALGMSSTVLEAPSARLATPYATDGTPTYYWDNTNAISGAGGLISDATDMGTWVAANLGYVSASAPLGVRTMGETLKPVSTITDSCSSPSQCGRADFRMGLGWQLYAATDSHVGAPWAFKNGGTAGMSTDTALAPSLGAGVTTMYNKARVGDEQLAIPLLALLVANRTTPERTALANTGATASAVIAPGMAAALLVAVGGVLVARRRKRAFMPGR